MRSTSRDGMRDLVSLAALVVGLLALASEDPQRFYPDMGTLYLKRIGELIATSLLCRVG